MIAVDEDREAPPRPVNGAVGEGELRQSQPVSAQETFVRDAPERDDDPQIAERGQRRREITPAGRDLQRRRLVLRGNAANRVDDGAIDQPEAVIRALLVGALGETVLKQRRVQEIAGIVAGKWAPGSVGAAQARRQSDDRDARPLIAESGHGRVMPRGKLATVFGAKLRQPRAGLAIVWRRDVERQID